MFKGTDKLAPGDIDRLTQRNGGRNNAWTSEDLTVYHFEFAADPWQIALDIEADRMRNLKIDDRHEFRQEKGAVIAELDRNEDGAFDLEQKTILPLLFGAKSPYGHPVIGEKSHVRGAQAEVIKGHYDRWYHPNNAVLVVCGDFDPDAALKLIRAKFETIPASKLPDRKTAEPVARVKSVRKDMPSKFEVARMVMGFNGVKSGDAEQLDYIDVVARIRGNQAGRVKTRRERGYGTGGSAVRRQKTARRAGNSGECLNRSIRPDTADPLVG
jgi:zinc protease